MSNAALKQAIDKDDAQSALAILNQNRDLLNRYCVPIYFRFLLRAAQLTNASYLPHKLPAGVYLTRRILQYQGIIQSFPECKYSRREGEYLSNTNGIIQSYPACKYSRREGEYLSNTNGITQSFPGSKYSGREGEYLSNTNGITQSFPECKYSGREGEYLSNTNEITQSFPVGKYSGREGVLVLFLNTYPLGMIG